MADVWSAKWTFYIKGKEYCVENVLTKKLPLPILIAKERSYDKAIKVLLNSKGESFLKRLDEGPYGLKKFTIEYIKKLGLNE